MSKNEFYSKNFASDIFGSKQTNSIMNVKNNTKVAQVDKTQKQEKQMNKSNSTFIQFKSKNKNINNITPIAESSNTNKEDLKIYQKKKPITAKITTIDPSKTPQKVSNPYFKTFKKGITENSDQYNRTSSAFNILKRKEKIIKDQTHISEMHTILDSRDKNNPTLNKSYSIMIKVKSDQSNIFNDEVKRKDNNRLIRNVEINLGKHDLPKDSKSNTNKDNKRKKLNLYDDENKTIQENNKEFQLKNEERLKNKSLYVKNKKEIEKLNNASLKENLFNIGHIENGKSTEIYQKHKNKDNYNSNSKLNIKLNSKNNNGNLMDIKSVYAEKPVKNASINKNSEFEMRNDHNLNENEIKAKFSKEGIHVYDLKTVSKNILLDSNEDKVVFKIRQNEDRKKFVKRLNNVRQDMKDTKEGVVKKSVAHTYNKKL